MVTDPARVVDSLCGHMLLRVFWDAVLALNTVGCMHNKWMVSSEHHLNTCYGNNRMMMHA